jgi:hypothetical protein
MSISLFDLDAYCNSVLHGCATVVYYVQDFSGIQLCEIDAATFAVLL